MAQQREETGIIDFDHTHKDRTFATADRLRCDVDKLFATLGTVQATLSAVQEQYDLIRELDHTILESTYSAEKVLEQIIAKGRKYTGSAHGQVVLVERDKLIVRASSEPSRVGEELPHERSLCGYALAKFRDLHCPDLSKVSLEQYVRFHESTQSELVLLIRPKQSSRVFGMLALEREQVGPFDEDAIEFASLLAGQAAIAIAQARIWKSVDLLHRISTGVLIGELSLEDAYREILYSALDILNFEYGQVLRADDDALVIVGSSRPEDIGLRVLPENSICGRYLLAEKGRVIKRIKDVSEGEYAQYYMALLKAPAARPMLSEMIVPLVTDRRLIGALNIESPRPAAFTEFDEKILDVLAKLMVVSLAAAFSRRLARHEDKIEAASLAMTHLGHVAQTFLHRFNNMIGDVRGNLIYLRNVIAKERIVEVEPGLTAPRFLEVLAGRLEDGATIVEQFALRFNPNDPKFKPRQMDLVAVAQRAVTKLQDRHLPAIAVTFAIQTPEGVADSSLAGLRIDCVLSDFVYEVLDNLLDNAVEAIQERQLTDTFEGVVHVTVSQLNHMLGRLRISDNGTGITTENSQRIFDFNFSTKKKERPIGGIGLWFCELYLIQKGGRIAFFPNEHDGHGTIFELEFPTALASSMIP